MTRNEASPGNPLVVVRRNVTADGRSLGRGLWIWCPGCNAAHRPQVIGEDGSLPDGPCWQWNGRTDEGFTISPSLLCYSSVHICEGQHEPVPCPDPDACGERSHAILNDDWRDTGARVLGHSTPHTADPAWGNCHSFIRDGHWQFLADSAHKLAGQTVPMVPVPDWVAGKAR